MSREYPDRPVVGVGAVVWRDERVLLIRRGRPPCLGQWSLPGGAQQVGETLLEAVAREILEETGLVAERVSFLTTVDLIERERDGRIRYHYTLMDFTAEAPQGEVVAGDDAAAVAWFALDELTTLGLWSETLKIIGVSAAQRRSVREA